MINISTQDIAAYFEGTSSISDTEMLQAMIQCPELYDTIEALAELEEIEDLDEIKESDLFKEL